MRKLLINTSLLLCILFPATAFSQEVFVQSGEQGQGVLRGRKNECFVITPYHVVKTAGGEIDIIGTKTLRAKGKLVQAYESPVDLAIIRIEGSLDCAVWRASDNLQIENQTNGHLRIREDDGSISNIAVNLRNIGSEFITIKLADPTDKFQMTMSGASLIVNEKMVGLLLSLCMKGEGCEGGLKKGEGLVFRVDAIMTKLQPFFGITPMMETASAQSILDRAIQARDGSVQGQNEAIESLLARGHDFSSSNLSGINFRGAKIAKGVFKNTRMNAIDLIESDARNTNFADSNFRFSNIEQANFAGATFTKVFAPFLWGKGVNFSEKANLSESNFFNADFQGADFSNANLRGVSFAFADLRGAKFDGADLTGAYLVGAVLDNATFVNAKIENTEFTGAVANEFLLTPQQKSGACRHYQYGEGDNFLEGWSITLYKASPRRNETFARAVFNFPTFTDRSLPLCTTEPLDAYYNTAKDGIQYAIFLNEGYVTKANRYNLFEQRMKEHGKFLLANLTKDRILKGDTAQGKGWDTFIRNAVKNTTPISKPYLNPDQLLLILLRAGLIDEKTLNWKELAESRFKYEADIQSKYKGEFGAYSMWSPLFPPGVFWNDLPEDKDALYKAWTMARIGRVSDQLVVKVPLSPSENKEGERLVIPLEKLNLGDVGNYYAGAEEKGIKGEYIISVSYNNRDYIELLKATRVVYVFPQKIENYKIELPDNFKNEKNLQIEIELKIEKVDQTQVKDDYGREEKTAYIFVTPGNVRLLKEGKLLWSGKILKDETAIEKQAWDKIKDSKNQQDFRGFLENFPGGTYAENAKVKLEGLAWDLISISCDEAKLKDFLKAFPNGANAPLAKARISRLVNTSDSTLNNLKSGSIKMIRLPKGAEMCFVWIPPGSFMMGSSEADLTEASKMMARESGYDGDNRDQFIDETPQRKVTIAEGFWLGQYEVTQGQWKTVMENEPHMFKYCVDSCPATLITWEAAKEFTGKLNEKNDGFEYELPTEAEWEYAARAGTTTAFAFGNSLLPSQVKLDLKNSQTYLKDDDEKSYGPARVGRYQPNSWNLFDMHGNVSEWVEDIYKRGYEGASLDGSANTEGDYPSSNMRVIRGGSSRANPSGARSARRDDEMQTRSSEVIGFRVLLKKKSAQRKAMLNSNEKIWKVESIVQKDNTRKDTVAVENNTEATEREAWDKIKDSNDEKDFQVFLEKFPNGTYTEIAKFKLRQIAIIADAKKRMEQIISSANEKYKVSSTKETTKENNTENVLKSGSNTPWLNGVWEGTASQSGSVTWKVILTAQNDKYLVEYPSLVCKGEWTLIEANSDRARFKEKITYGFSNCVDNGEIVIKGKSSSQILFEYFEPKSSTPTAAAILDRRR